MRTWHIMATVLLLAGPNCSQDTPQTGHPPAPATSTAHDTGAATASKRAPAPADPGTGAETLTAFERSLIDPVLAEIRQGVRPFGEHGIGICKGTGKTCKAYLGTDVGVLPPGKYMVRAELAVPNVGDRGTWKVRFETTCETTSRRGDTTHTTKRSTTKEYEVVYVGPDRGYRLSPLRVIESPMVGGSARCSYKLVALHKDGDKVYTGSWEVPEKT